MAHELGHNFGDWHSNSQPCENGACSVSEYGDDRDMMGGSGQGHFNAYQKERLGWLNYGASPAIQTVTAPGTYFISALQTTDASPKALKVLQTAATGANTYYYVETRAQIGFDSGYAPGVLIHTGNESNGNTSLQIDLDPFSSGFDSMLDPGQSFTDASAQHHVPDDVGRRDRRLGLGGNARRAVHDARAERDAVAVGHGVSHRRRRQVVHDDREE